MLPCSPLPICTCLHSGPGATSAIPRPPAIGSMSIEIDVVATSGGYFEVLFLSHEGGGRRFYTDPEVKLMLQHAYGQLLFYMDHFTYQGEPGRVTLYVSLCSLWIFQTLIDLF